jgi:hypothetical protein
LRKELEHLIIGHQLPFHFQMTQVPLFMQVHPHLPFQGPSCPYFYAGAGTLQCTPHQLPSPTPTKYKQHASPKLSLGKGEKI